MYLFKPSELYKACRAVFKEDTVINSTFFNNLDLDTVKKSYRQKVFEVHPDMYSGNDKDEIVRRSVEFNSIVESYELIVKYIMSCNSKKNDNNIKREYSSNKNAGSERNIYKEKAKNIPLRNLMLGEFLYYSGRIVWKDLIDAVVWQRKQRDRLGDIAKRWGWLAENEIFLLSKYRNHNELIGEIFVRFDRISKFQLKTLLFQQRQEQPKIGEYFVGKKLLGKTEVLSWIDLLNNHNKFVSKG